MSIDQLLREELRRSTADVEGGPDLATAIRSGRRRRTTRRVAIGAGAVAIVAGASFSAAGLVAGGPADHDSPTAVAPAEDSPTLENFVTHSRVDETMQATIAAHLPSLPAASDVYASDWTRDRPLPDARADEGTDWEAHYELGSGESFMVVMGYVKPSDRAGDACAAPQGDPAAPSCEVDPGRDGSTTTTTAYQNLSNGLYYFQTTFMSDDGGWVVSTFDKVRAESWTDAFAGRSVDQASAVDLVNDHLMKFTAPASWPS